MRKKMKSAINYFVIILCVFLGVLGIIVPVLPGLVFIAMALIILSIEMPFINNQIEKRLDKEKSVGKVFYKIRDKVEKYFK